MAAAIAGGASSAVATHGTDGASVNMASKHNILHRQGSGAAHLGELRWHSKKPKQAKYEE